MIGPAASARRADAGDPGAVGTDLAALAEQPWSYREPGATAGQLPAGYRHLRRQAVLGRGATAFDRAVEKLTTWGMHRGAGLAVEASHPYAVPGAVVILRIGFLRAPCRVVYTVDEPNRRGFAYGTLPGHPESGEESFVIDHDPGSGQVTARITAFSRPATRLAQLGGPISRAVQSQITARYLAALRQP